MNIKKILLILITISIGNLAQAVIYGGGGFGGAGYYYTVIDGGDHGTKRPVGPFESMESCLISRESEQGDGDITVPWAGAPGCFEVFESDLEVWNEIYSLAKPNFPLDTIRLHISKIITLLNNIEDLDEAYNINQYKQEREQLIQDALRSRNQ